MVLSTREKAIAVISNGISVYSMLQERDAVPRDTTIYDYILKAVPADAGAEITADLIDEVFEYVSSAHSS